MQSLYDQNFGEIEDRDKLSQLPGFNKDAKIQALETSFFSSAEILRLKILKSISGEGYPWKLSIPKEAFNFMMLNVMARIHSF